MAGGRPWERRRVGWERGCSLAKVLPPTAKRQGGRGWNLFGKLWDCVGNVFGNGIFFYFHVIIHDYDQGLGNLYDNLPGILSGKLTCCKSDMGKRWGLDT